jgi:hypothetical protein
MELFTNISSDLSADPWIKVVDMLQQNWAVIVEKDDTVLAVFYEDTCGVFDQISFNDRMSAEMALMRNGFQKFNEHPTAAEFIALPEGEFRERPHPNGYVYSSGRFWK